MNMMKRKIKKIFKNMGYHLKMRLVYFLIMIVLNFMMKNIVRMKNGITRLEILLREIFCLAAVQRLEM